MALNPLLAALVQQSQAKYSGNTGSTVKPKDGRNTIRLIVPAAGQVSWVGADGKFWRDLGVHWIKATKDGKPLAVVGCSQICHDKPSVIAAAIDMAIANAVDEEQKELFKEWSARKTVLVNVVNRDNKDAVEVWELTPTTFGKILDNVNLYLDQGVNILDPAMGCDIVITKSGAGLTTKYDVAVAPIMPGKSFPPVTDDQISKASDLDKFINSNFFRGEEQKALNVIATTAGIRVPQLGAPTTPTAALTSQAATVPGATVQQPDPAQQAALLAAQQQAAALAAQQQAAALAAQQQAALMAAQQQQQAAAAMAQQATIVTPAAVTVDTSLSSMSTDAQAALLAELNSIGLS